MCFVKIIVNYRFQMKCSINLILVITTFFVVKIHCYDAYSSCSKQYRASKSKKYYPCELTTQTWCNIPGSYYPWRAVRRFVYENHGLMKRMYGEERHISVLRSEFDSNDIEYQIDKWTEDFKKYKFKKDDYKAEKLRIALETTTSSTSTTTSPSLPTTTVKSTVPTETTAVDSDISTLLEVTSSADIVTETTTEFEETTLKDSDKSKPIIYQDTVEKTPQSLMEENETAYKSKGVNACPVKEEVVAPFWANNTRGEVLALLNLYPFEQYVHWERCTYEHRQMFCRSGCRCEQQYRLHRLLAYDPTNDCRGIFSDWFKFPSCCVCKCYNLPSEYRLTSRSPRNRNTTILN